MSGFHGAFATGVASQQGTLTPSRHLVPSPILGLANAPIVETKYLELAMSLLDFSPRIPLGTFSILLLAITGPIRSMESNPGLQIHSPARYLFANAGGESKIWDLYLSNLGQSASTRRFVFISYIWNVVPKQNRESTKGCSKWIVRKNTSSGKGLASTRRTYASPKWDGTRCPEE